MQQYCVFPMKGRKGPGAEDYHGQQTCFHVNSKERPPGSIQHVLTVLVFWSGVSVLLLPQLLHSSWSLRLFPWASILLHGHLVTWTFAWICCSQLPYHPCKNGTHSTCFYSTGGHTPILTQKKKKPVLQLKWLVNSQSLRAVTVGPALCRNVSGIFAVQIFEDLPGILLEDFSRHFFPTKMRKSGD